MWDRPLQPGPPPVDDDGSVDDRAPSPRPWEQQPWWRHLLTEVTGRRAGVVALAASAVLAVAMAAGVALVGLRSGGSVSLDDTIPHIDDVALPPLTAAEVQVHVAGAVARPGVYRLAAGGRVSDAVDAAGGFAIDAQPDRLNLAEELRDGSQVYVPRVGETGLAAGAGAKRSDSGPAGGDTVDVNVAAADELERLPGIGPALAAAIIRHRDTYGPFASLDDLMDVAGIGPAKLEGLRDAARV